MKLLTLTLLNSSAGLTFLGIDVFEVDEADSAITWWGELPKKVFQVITNGIRPLGFHCLWQSLDRSFEDSLSSLFDESSNNVGKVLSNSTPFLALEVLKMN